MEENALVLKMMLASLAPRSENYLHLIWEEQLWIKKNKQQNQPKKEISVTDQISLFIIAQSNNYRLFIEIENIKINFYLYFGAFSW